MRTVDLVFYAIVSAQIKGEGSNAYAASKPGVRLTRGKPALDSNEVPIRISLSLPISLFKRPALEATIVIPPEAAPPAEIDATLQDNITAAIREATGLNVRLTVESPTI